MSGGVNLPGFRWPTTLKESQQDEWTQSFQMPRFNPILPQFNPIEIAQAAIGTLVRIPSAIGSNLSAPTGWDNKVVREAISGAFRP
jgi:hypothetical protein